MKSDHSRRKVPAHVAAATIASRVSRAGPTLAAQDPARDKLNLAIVGCGGRGLDNLEGVAGENIVALCDVDERQAAKAFKMYPKAARFRDYRKLFDAMHGKIDAVVVSTPDHMHAPISLAAMELGKHVYCEKPLTWGIDEARKMARIAREKRLATQMGTQGMAGDRSRMGIEIIRSGVLGEITELHVWTDRPAGWWDQGIERPQDNQPVPAGLDWNLWLGVAPERPYHSAYCPFAWRGWKDFGTGAAGDMGIHNAAMPFAALELGPPSSAEIIETSGLKHETFRPGRDSRSSSRPVRAAARLRCFGMTGENSREPGWLRRAAKRTVRSSSGPKARCPRPNGPAAIGRCCQKRGSGIQAPQVLRTPGTPGKSPPRMARPLAVAARQPIAGSTDSRRNSPKPCSWPISRCGPARRSTGTPSRWRRGIALKPCPLCDANIVSDGKAASSDDIFYNTTSLPLAARLGVVRLAWISSISWLIGSDHRSS